MRHFTSLLFSLFIIYSANAQQFDSLSSLKNHAIEVYYSHGYEQRADFISQRVDKAMAYYQQLLGFRPTVTLLILSAKDWNKYASRGAVFGMPHYDDHKTLIVAAHDNPFWKSFVPPLDQLPPTLSEQIKIVYKNSDSSLSMQPFFDLLAIHELGHAFHLQGGLKMQRKWMGELYVNILLHTYIAENEPASLPALTLFPQMVVAGGSKEFTYTSLQDIQNGYNEIAQRHPKNYGWYQCRWHSAAADIYDASGKQICRKLWNAFKDQKEILSDEQLLIFLNDHSAKPVADMIRNWNSSAIK